MKKWKFLLITALSVLNLAHSCIYVSAQSNETKVEEDTSATNGDYDFLKDETVTETFYIPKSRFMSDYDYEKYCEDMYNRGYMNKLHEWTPAAQEYINNMTPETSKALDEDAKAIVEERIESGEMQPEDNPYLTYDEKQAIIKEKEATSDNPVEVPDKTITETPTETPSISESPTEVPDEGIDDAQDEKTDNEDEVQTQKDSGFNIVKTIVIGLGIIIIIIIGVYIYKRQF